MADGDRTLDDGSPRRRDRRCVDGPPQSGARMVDEHVDVAMVGEGGQRLQARGVDAADTEDAQPLGKLDGVRVVAECRAGIGQRLGGVRRGERLA